MSAPALLDVELLDRVRDRRRVLEEHGRLYASLGFAIVWTNGIQGDYRQQCAEVITVSRDFYRLDRGRCRSRAHADAAATMAG